MVSRLTQTDLPHQIDNQPSPPPPVPPPVEQQSKATQTTITKLVPLAGTYSVGDRRKDSCIDGLRRLRKVTPPGFHWTALMITVLLRFVYYAVVKLNWSWNTSCDTASDIFSVNVATVRKFDNLHLQTPEDVALPPELPLAVRGRGSAKFKANDVNERFKLIKEEHLKCILTFVRERNRSWSGMYSV